MEGIHRVDDTPVHKAIRECFVNAIIHADYKMDSGTLRIIKKGNEFFLSNPGCLKLPEEQIFRGGMSKTRNPHIQTMLRFVGYGDNAGSGFPTILKAWKEGLIKKPELIEDTIINEVTAHIVVKEKVGDSAQETIVFAQEINVPAQEINNSAQENDDFAQETGDSADITTKIMSLMLKNPYVTTREIAATLGKSTDSIKHLLSDMKKKNLIEHIGPTKKGEWIVH